MLGKFKHFPYIVLFRAIWHHAKGTRGTYILALCALQIAQIISLLNPYIIGKLINHIQGGLDTEDQLKQAVLLCIILFLTTPLFWLFHGPARVFERRVAFFVQKHFLQESYAHIRQLPYIWHQNFHSGQLVDRIRKSANSLSDFAGTQFQYLGIFTNFFGPLLVLVWLSPWISIACIAMIAAGVVVIRLYDQRLVPLFRERNRLTHIETGLLNDYLANIRTIITLRLGSKTQEEFMQRVSLRQEPQWSEITLHEYKWGVVSHIADFFVALLIIIVLVWVYKGSTVLDIGSIVMLIQYLTRFASVFFSIGGMYQQMVQQATDYTSVQPIEEEYEKYMNNLGQCNLDASQIPWHTIDVQELRFAYRDAYHRPHTLQDMNFTIGCPEKIALVGSSGSGKSTLMTLLRGLYDVDHVKLKIDDQEFDTLYPLKAITTLIPQDPEIFENTILYNITFGVAHPEEEIFEACRIACFDTVLANLPHGLNTDIREKGVNLSGGQRQRLALARGVFAIQRSPIILLDEPTSSIDTATETKIFDNLFRAFPDKTMMAAVHRLHLLPLFDRVMVLDQGKIVQQGNFDALIKQDGLLRHLWLNYRQHIASSEV